MRLALTQCDYVGANEVSPLASSLYRASLVGMWGQRREYPAPLDQMRQFCVERRPPVNVSILVGKSELPFIFAGGHDNYVSLRQEEAQWARSFAFGTLGSLFVLTLLTGATDRFGRDLAKVAIKRSEGTMVQLWPRRRRERVHLPRRRISAGLASRCAEVAVLLHLREPMIPDLSAHDHAERLLPGGSVWRRSRMPESHLPPAEHEMESWVQVLAETLPRLREGRNEV